MIRIAPQDRNTPGGQSYALYPHSAASTVPETRLKKTSAARSSDVCGKPQRSGDRELVQLQRAYGGQRQRGDVGRRDSDPEYFLFDAPLSNLTRLRERCATN